MESILLKIVKICHSQFKYNYLKNETLFLHILFHFWKRHQILNILKQKMIVIANEFPQVRNVKNLVRPISKKRPFRTCFDSQHVKASQILRKSQLVLGELLAVFVNTLTTDGKYSVQDCENLQLPIEMKLSEKRKRFSQFFVRFHQSTSNIKHIEKEDYCHS